MAAREWLIDTMAHIPPAKALEHLTPEDAERRVHGANHSIAEIVAHANLWATWFCNRCEGAGAPMVTSAATGWPAVTPGSWPELQRQFLSTLERAVALGDIPGRLASPVAPPIEFPPLSNYTIGDALVHIANHNAHHLGQVIILRQIMGGVATALGELDLVMMRRLFAAVVFATGVAALLSAQPQFSDSVRAFIKVDAPVVALTNVRVIDGTGAPARANQTIVIRNGNIEAVGDTARLPPPAGATTLDLAGRSVIPGLVMVHEHLYYPAGPGVYGQLGESFIRLYLAGGVTTMRTAGNVNGFMDLKLKRLIDAGQKAGPAIDATAPYLNGVNTFSQMRDLKGPDDARRQVAYWADEGATSFKAYMQISRAELGAAIEEVHKRGFKITGHLCSVTYAEAADLGIDNLEHGFLAATDFVTDKQPDVCPGQGRGQQTIAALDENGEPFKALVKTLVDRHVALTSTLTVFETFTPGRPVPPGVDVLLPQLRDQFLEGHARTARNQQSIYPKLFPKALALERAFVKAGGTLLAGTDPTGGGGVVPGYANQRQLELLVEAGFSPLEAIGIGTANGAKFLGRDARVGTIAAGKQADLVVVNGDPSANIADVRNVEIVFKQGVGFDPAKLIDSVRGKAGLW